MTVAVATRSRVVLIDLDDTVYDRTSVRPQVVLRRSFSELLQAPDLLDERIRFLRTHSELLQVLGARPVRHRPSSAQMLGLLWAFYGELPDLRRDPGPPARLREAAVVELRRLGRLRSPGDADWREAFAADLRVRAEAARAGALHEVVAWAVELARRPAALALATAMDEAQEWSAYPRFREVGAWLDEHGATWVITSEGDEVVQRAKLERLGLPLADRLITTDRAAAPLDGARLRAHVARLLAAVVAGEADAAFAARYYPFQWALDRYGSKRDEFWRRPIAACAASPDAPVAALDRLDVPERGEQIGELLVIGDNPPKDAAPVRALVGEDATLWVLDRGKHARATEAGVGERISSWSAALERVRSSWPEEERSIPVPPVLSVRQRAAIRDGAGRGDIRSEYDVTGRLAELAGA